MSQKKKKAATPPAGAQPASPTSPVSPSPAPAVGGGDSKENGVDEAGWETIKDDKKARYEVRKLKKVQKEAEEAAKKGDANAQELAKAAAELKAAVTGQSAEDTKSPKAKGPATTPKKKKGGKAQLLNISTEKQMIEAVISILANVPNGEHIHISAIGNRLHDMTGHSWNAKFKTKYGTLPQFVGAHPQQFHVTADQLVYIKAEYDAIKAATDPLGKKAKRRKPAAGNESPDAKGLAAPPKSAKNPLAQAGGGGGSAGSGNVKRRRRGGSGGDDERDDDDDGPSALRIAFVILLVAVVMLATFIALEGVSGEALMQRIRSFLK